MKTEPTQLVFPADSRSHTDSGMNLRQYYAGLAMQGYCGGEYIGQSGMPHNEIAEWSVKMADTLIEQLNRNI